MVKYLMKLMKISLNEDASAFLKKKILSDLDFCHWKGIIYRDIKFEEILNESREEANKYII